MKNIGVNYMKSNKIQLTKSEFDDIYEIKEGITEETEVTTGKSAPNEIPNKQDTTPDTLTEAEQLIDDTLESPPDEAIYQ